MDKKKINQIRFLADVRLSGCRLEKKDNPTSRRNMNSRNVLQYLCAEGFLHEHSLQYGKGV